MMPNHSIHRWSRLLVLSMIGALTGVVASVSAPANAADLGGFEPGFIISDAVFYDSTTMSAGQVQAFLDQYGARCVAGPDGTPCLRTFRQATATRAADARCPGQYTGAADESAATIIANVAQACGINPQVILATLQKEQGLVTASGSSLTSSRYRSAMGYGCPDTAVCDAKYYGFFNQVYSAASQFKNYANNPSNYSHRAGMTNNVRYHPNAACGSAPVFIQNQATASLYNYTPYQPNPAALAAGYASGDACSSYGNRNFWNYFTDWFGPTTQRMPFGVVDGVATTPSSINVAGWALDPDTTSPINVHVYVDGVPTVTTADGLRTDVGAAYHKGDRHGFSVTVPSAPGTHQVCTYAIDSTGGNPLLECRTVVIVNHEPFGAVDNVSATLNSIIVSGWAMDPDSSGPIPVHVYVDGVGLATPAQNERPDVAAVYRNGSAHGFSVAIAAAPGAHQVCVYAIDSSGGRNTGLECRTVTVQNKPPFGTLDLAAPTTGGIAVGGWALDPDTSAPINVHIYVDSAGIALSADTARPDVEAAYHNGASHGYYAVVPATSGRHSVCAYGIDSAGGVNTILGCRSVVVADNTPPVGSFDLATAVAGGIRVDGWALDPDSNAPIDVHVYVDGVGSGYRADGVRPDVAALYGRGDLHGFSAFVAAGAGDHQVCVYGIDSAGGVNALLGCRSLHTS